MTIKGTHPLGKNWLACTGCAACAAICTEHCIFMRPDSEGFLQPQIDNAVCTDCGICRQTCPVIDENLSGTEWYREERQGEPLRVFAGWHLDGNIRRTSSSGGVFTALAENILAQGGVVVGATFNDQLVVRHTIVEKSEHLHRLRGSKYVQSELLPSVYYQIHDFLEHNYFVLFSGTPCQVAGIRSFLKKCYTRLYCVDLVCMGVPSPELLREYINWKSIKTGSRLLSCEFRNKTFGWKSPCLSHQIAGGNPIYEKSGQNPYYRAFYMKGALRYSCYACNHKGIERFGDLTIGDFWGVGKTYPEYDRDDKGTSLVLVNNKKGQIWFDACRKSLFLGKADLDTAIVGNPMLIRSIHHPTQRDTFYRDLDAMHFSALIKKYHLYLPSIFQRGLSFIKKRLIAACGRLAETLRFTDGRIK